MKLRTTLAAAALLALPALGLAQEGSSSKSRGSGIEIGELLQQYAKRSGKKIVVDPRVRAVVELAGFDLNQLTYDQLLAILHVHAFVAMEASGVITVMPDAVSRQLPTPVYLDAGFQALDHEVVTVLLEVRNACAAYMVPILRPLLPQAAHMAAAPQSNMLVLTDEAANVKRIAKLVERLDRAAPAGQKCPVEVIWQQPGSAPRPVKDEKDGKDEPRPR